jgi:hypothetical protein
MDEGLAHPFVLTGETEDVLELAADHPAAQQACNDIHIRHKVDVSKKKLKKTSRTDPSENGDSHG